MFRLSKTAIITWFFLLFLACRSLATPIYDVRIPTLAPTENSLIDSQNGDSSVAKHPCAQNCGDTTSPIHSGRNIRSFEKQTELSVRHMLRAHHEGRRATTPSPSSLEASPRKRRGEVPSPPSSPSLSKRTFNPSDHATLKMTKFTTFYALIPTLAVAMKLEDFYNIIGLKILTGAFSNRPPSYNIIFELWDFELNITCDKMPVPWSFIQAWVIDMASASSQNFIGFYEATVRGEGALSGLVFLVKMKLKDPPLSVVP